MFAVMSYLDNFNYKIYGPAEGRKWIFLHGLMGYAQNWRKVISGLEATEQCLVYDQRGHGKSFQPESGYTSQDYADDLRLIVDELQWDQFILVGHSLGGRNALNFAARFPETLTHLVIEDIGPESDPDGPAYYEQLLNVVPTPFASRTEAKEFFQGNFLKLARTRERAEVMAGYFYANMEEKPDGTVSWRFSKQGILDSVKELHKAEKWDEVKALQVPTLLVRGAESPRLKSEIYEKMLEINPMIKGVEIPGAGHWVHSDQSLAFTETLKAFVGGF